MPVKQIVNAKAHEGVITHVKFKDTTRFTPVARAIPMAERGKIENVHVVRRLGAKAHLRTDPDGKKSNNLDELAKRPKRRR